MKKFLGIVAFVFTRKAISGLAEATTLTKLFLSIHALTSIANKSVIGFVGCLPIPIKM